MPAGQIPATPAREGDLPERFKSAADVITLAAQMFGADQKRAALRSQIIGLYSGAPVYPLAKLQQMGQAWRARTNYRGLEGIISENCTLDYDVETQGEQIVCIYLDIGEGQQRADWERIMADEFKWMFQKRWKGFNYHIPKRQFNKNLHGLGFHIWPEDHVGNWIPRTPSTGEVLFPDDCPFNFSEEGDFFLLRDFVPSYKLYRYIENKKEAEALGWNTKMVWKALTLLDKQQGRNRYGVSNPDWLAKQYEQGDIGYWTTRQSGVYINSVFVREYESGKVSQYSTAEGLDLNEYLYKKRDKYEDWPIDIFPYDIGNGNIHSVKGLGERTKDFYEMMNRMKNAGVDQIMISAYPNMKQLIQNIDPDKMKLAKIGGLNWLPYGAEPQVIQFPDLEKGLLAMEANLNQTMVQNNRSAGGQVQIEQKDRMTSEEYQMRSQDMNHLSTASMAMHKSRLDGFYNRVVRNCAKPSGSKQQFAVIAREWRERCMDRGVPPEAFKRIGEVEAVMAYGKGSASARINAFMTMMQSPIYLQAPIDKQIALERSFTGALLGQSAVNQYCRDVDSIDIPTSDTSLAVQENNGMSNGGEAQAGAQQDHVTHLSIHFQKVGEIAMAYKEGQADPQQSYAAVVQFGIHTKQHLDFLRTNPLKAEDFKFFFNQWQQLSRMADKMRADLESAAEATPPEQQLSEDFQIGMAKVQVQGELGALKANNSAQLKMRQQMHREAMDQQKLAAQQERDNVRTLHDIQRSTLETGASIAQDTALTDADIQNKRRKAATV